MSALRLQAWSEDGRGIVKEAVRGHGGHSFGYAHRFVDFFLNLCDDLLCMLFRKQITPGEKFLEPGYRVFCTPGLDLGRVTIARGVIGGGMGPPTIGEGFYRCPPPSLAATPNPRLHDVLYSHELNRLFSLGV